MRWVHPVGCGASFQPVGPQRLRIWWMCVRGEGKALKGLRLPKTEVAVWRNPMTHQTLP